MDTPLTKMQPTRRPGRVSPAGHLRTLAALVAIFLMFAALGCGGSGLTGSAQPQPPAPAVPVRPVDAPTGLALPAPNTVRFASTPQSARLAAWQEVLPTLRSANTTLQGAGLYMQPNWDGAANREPAWAGFVLDMTGYSGAPELGNALEYASGKAPTLYYGLADWDSNRWRWFEGTANNPTGIDSLQPFIRVADNKLLVVVLLTGSYSGELAWVRAGTNVPAYVAVTPSPASGPAPLGVEFELGDSYDADSELKLLFDFEGTGQFVLRPEDQGNAFHTYATAGVYHAVVRSVEGDGSHSDYPVTITVAGYRPRPQAAADVSIGQPGLTVNFDAAGSSDPDGGVTSYSWDLDGDGSDDTGGPGATTASFQYTQVGTYHPRLTVTDNTGLTASTKLTIVIGFPIHETEPNDSAVEADELPTAPFQNFLGEIGPAAPGAGNIDYVKLRVLRAGDYQFDLQWGDSTANLNMELRSETYHLAQGTASGFEEKFSCSLNPGEYWLSIVNATPTKTTQYSLSLSVAFTALPVPALSAVPTAGSYPLAVEFNAGTSYDPDGVIVKYEWDPYGDNHYEADTGTSSQYSFTYKRRGVFTARVRVTDDQGARTVGSMTVMVDGPALDEQELNNSYATAQPLALPLAGFTGDCGPGGGSEDLQGDNFDIYVLDLPASGTLHLELDYAGATCGMRFSLSKLQPDLSTIYKTQSTGTSGHEALDWVLAESGKYVVYVTSYYGSSEYTLSAQVN